VTPAAAAPSVALSGALALALASLSACSKDARETAKTVLTLQSGSMTALRAQRGDGPFRTYPVPPREMLSIVAAVLKTKVVAVFEEPHRGEVSAKEREAKLATADTYADAWKSAVIVFVHPVPGDDGSSKVEFHSAQKGPFDAGCIRWDAELPLLLDDAVAHRGTTPIRPLK
jgi:hypothetical protein